MSLDALIAPGFTYLEKYSRADGLRIFRFVGIIGKFC